MTGAEEPAAAPLDPAPGPPPPLPPPALSVPPPRPPPLPPLRPRLTLAGAVGGADATPPEPPALARDLDPYTPVLPGRRPRWWALGIGLVLAGLGAYSVFSLVPTVERALDAAEARSAPSGPERGVEAPIEPRFPGLRKPRHRSPFHLDDDAREVEVEVDGKPMGRSDLEEMRLAGWCLLIGGLAIALLLGTHRPGRLRFCDVCDRDTVFRPRSGWRCERCQTRR